MYSDDIKMHNKAFLTEKNLVESLHVCPTFANMNFRKGWKIMSPISGLLGASTRNQKTNNRDLNSDKVKESLKYCLQMIIHDKNTCRSAY